MQTYRFPYHSNSILVQGNPIWLFQCFLTSKIKLNNSILFSNPFNFESFHILPPTTHNMRGQCPTQVSKTMKCEVDVHSFTLPTVSTQTHTGIAVWTSKQNALQSEAQLIAIHFLSWCTKIRQWGNFKMPNT